MVDMVASDLTYTIKHQKRTYNARNNNVVTVAFGDGALDYPAGGIPLTKGKMGAPTLLESLNFSDSGNANGFVYKYDQANEKIRIYQGDNDNAADAPLIELGNVAIIATSLEVEIQGY